MADGVNWTGTDDEDRYVGTSNDDTLDGGRGDDEILAGAGADTIEGGRGNDVIYGGEGNDVISDEDLTSTSGQKLYGEGGNDTITGGGQIYGGDGNDTIKVTETGDASHEGRAYGGDGDDTIVVDGGATGYIYAEAGDDILNLRSKVHYQFDAGDGDDTVTLEETWDIAYWNESRLGAGDDSLNIFDWEGNTSQNFNAYGGSGDDTYTGRDVDKTNNTYDYFYGEDGEDTITGGDADEYFDGGADEDTISGGYGDDILLGGSDSDTITGGDGADTITGGEDADTLTGGAGQDIFVYNSRNDEGDVVTDFTPGEGGDLLDFRPLFSSLGYTGADPFGEGWLELEQDGDDLNVNLDRNGGGDNYSDTLVTLRNVDAKDFITQNALPAGPLSNDPVTWTGTEADERYVSGGGDDTLDGGRGDDEILAGAGADTIEGGRGNDVIYGGEGNDVISDEDLTSTSGQKLYGEGGNDTITGGGQIYGGDGNDTIKVTETGDASHEGRAYGGDGDDTIVVDGGATGYIYAEAGDDILNLRSKVHYQFDAGDGDDTVTLEETWDIAYWNESRLGAGDDSLNIFDWEGNTSQNFNAYGGSGDDTYTGRDVDKTNNTYDYFYGEDGEDTITGGDADEYFDGGADEDTISGGYGDDILLGGSDSDTITGGDGADTITGGEDADTLTGGAGQDIFVYNSRNDEGDVVTDFTPGEGGDLLDFRPLFSSLGYTGADPFGEGWLELEQDGDDLNVNLDRNGGGDNYSDTLVTLRNVDAKDFITQNALPAGPLSNDPVTWTGTEADERYVSGGGDDTLDGGRGDDEILAGAGADTIEGGRGNDVIYGGEGNDVISDEDLTSTSGQKLYGEGGNDTITGGGQIYGGDGNDTIKVTETGDASHEGRAYGGDGDDTIVVDGGATGYIYAEAGDDILNLRSKVHYQFDAGDGDDTVTLEETWDIAYWNESRLGAGDDSLNIFDWEGNTSQNFNAYGGSGDDTYTGRDVDKTNNTYDYFYGEDGEDTITGGDADEYFDGGADEDTISGGYGDDILLGGSDSDTITGGDGADTITGGEDADTLTGGAGQDIFVYNSRNDEGDVVTDFTPGEGGDLLDFRPLFSSLGYTGADPFGEGWLELEQDGDDLNVNLDRNGGGDNYSDTLVTLRNVDAKDFITQNALPAGPLDTYAAPDPTPEPDPTPNPAPEPDPTPEPILPEINGVTWTGTDGADRYVGSADNDSLDGGRGDDEILAGAGADIIEGGRGNDVIYGGEGNDVITDEDADALQKLYGEGGNDTITGGGQIYGGDGDDIINVTEYISNNSWDNNQIWGGDGDDTITVDQNGASDWDGVSYLRSGSGDDVVTVYSYVYEISTDSGDDQVTLDGDFNSYRAYLADGDDTLNVYNWEGFSSSDFYAHGGSGDDTYTGRDVDKTNNTYDYFYGEDGEDTITGGDADEYFDGGADEDTISGGYGDDILLGGSDSDTITGGDGADTITGGEDADTLTGGAGQDIFVYNSRNDEGDVVTDFTPGEGGDLLDFRPLFSTLGYTGADPFGEGWLELEQDGDDLNVNLDRNGGGDNYSDTLVTLRNVDAKDFITQNALPAGPLSNDPITWTGTEADERYVSGGGDDTLDGGRGDDEILAGAGADIIEGGRGNDVIYGGEGNDVITDEDADALQKLYGEGGNDTITGGGQIYGGDGDDIINVTEYISNNSWDNNQIWGGDGDDTITVDQNGASDWDGVSYLRSGSGDDVVTVYSYVYEISTDSGDDQVTLDGDFNSYRAYLADGDDTLNVYNWEGFSSSDFYAHGGSGDDTYTGRDVDKTNNTYDYFYGEDGEDTITGGDADEYFDGGADEDTISGGYGDDILLGGSDSDTITGGDGADTITGGEDADTLTGGAGQDIFVYNSRNDEGDVVTDFTPGEGGDLLDFRPLFSTLGYTGADPFGEGWLELEQDGDDLNVNLDRNGGGDNYSDTLVTLRNVDAKDFITQNALPAGPLSNDPITWTGTEADERYVSGGGDDTLDGGRGDDEILAGAGADIIEGGRGNDVIYGGEGNDVITDEDADALQKLYGEGGNDTITGGGQIYGGDGDDIINVTEYISNNSWDNNQIWGGDGDDTITVDQNGASDWDGVSYLRSGSGDDVVTVYSYVYEISTDSGDDQVTLDGDFNSYRAYLADGDDTLNVYNWEGFSSSDFYAHGGSGDDTYTGRDVDKTNNTYDYFYGEDGEDTITGGDADEYFDGGADEDTISGGYGDDILLGGSDSDTITGGDGADTITGGEDADTLTGGAGQDIFVYNSRNDEGDVVTDFTPGEGGDLLDFRPLFSTLGYTGADPFGEGWLELEQDGDDLNVNLDRNGGGDNYSDTLVTLRNVDAKDFITQNALPAGPLSNEIDDGDPNNAAPNITDIYDQEYLEDSSSTISFTISDDQTATSDLAVSVSSSVSEVVSEDGLTLSGTKDNRSLVITPEENATGETTITITVSDGDKRTRESFDVTVTEVNDAPVGSEDALEFEVAENAALYTEVGSVSVNFSDEDDGDELSYSISSGDDDGVFSINSTTGLLRVAGSLDFALNPSYELEVKATDLAGASATSEVNISITDVLDDITEPNDSFETAYDINTKSGVSLDVALADLSGLRISNTTDDDYYKFYVESGETFDILTSFSHSEGDLDVSLYDAAYNYLADSASSTDNESLTASRSGTYYLHVYGYAGAEANYSLSATAGSSAVGDVLEENDTFETAYNAGVIPASDAYLVEDLTIDAAGDDDYYRFGIDTEADIEFTVKFDHAEGDLDIELYDGAGNWLDSSTTVSDEEIIYAEGMAAGEYVLRVYGYNDAVSSSYSVEADVTLQTTTFTPDAYEKNESFSGAYDLGSIASTGSAGAIVSNANIHSSSDEDFYSFKLGADQNLVIEALFSHSSGDLDIELLDSSGYWIDGSSSGDDNEYIYLSGLEAGTYTLRAYGYDGATLDSYNIRFAEEDSGEEQIAADSFEENDDINASHDLGSITSASEISALPNLNDLTIDSSGDADWFKFTYDAATRLDVGISFDGAAADLDMELFKAGENWIEGSYGVEGSEEISLVGLASGEYYLKIYEYSDATVADYDLSFSVSSSAAIGDLNDTYEPNNSFETATDMGDATGEGSVTNLTLTSGDVDWYKAYFANDGTPDQYVSAVFDHQDGDIDIEFYDDTNTLLRSSTSVTDNETIYLSDIEGGSYYYMRVSAYGDTAFQEYSLDYSFPVVVSEATISADTLEGSSGNETYSAASSVALISSTEDLTLHTATDIDWFSFETRNLSSSASKISMNYDEAMGSMNLALWAVDVGASAPSLVTSSSSGTGREVISFEGYAAGTYYLEVTGEDGALIPDYSLSMDVTELEGGGSQSNVIPADQFDRASSNDTSATATDLGTLSTTLNVADLSIHSSTDKDFLQFATTYAGETQITLSFSHEGGDIDTSLKDSGGTEIAYAMSGDDNETLTFQSSIDESYTLEVYGYDGDTSRDYDLSIAPKQLNSRRDDYESNDDASSAVTVRDTRASFDNLTLHNASDQDWFKFTIAETAGSSNAVQVTNLLGADAELKIYSSDGTTQVGSTVSITDGSGSVDTSGFASGDYYAVVSSTASSDAAASAQLSNYNLYVDQVSGVAPTENASWTVMVYVDGDNNLASAAVDDLNEMEGVVLPEGVNVVTLTDLSDDYATSETWTDTRMGEIAPDPNGYNPYGWAGGSWAGPADALTSDLVSVGEKNMGDAATLTDFIDWSTTNHAADNYALVIWDHGGGLSGIAWDDTDGHDNLTISEIKAGIENSAAFSSSNSLDLIGFDACLMQTYEVGLEMAPIADVMVASQETEPGDGWDYQAFLQSLADNPYASAQTLGGYIVDSYDTWYDSSAETLSSVDLTKYQDIDDAIATFNLAALTASGSEWLVVDDAAENAWSSAAWDYGWAGEERDLGQFFEYISENASNNSLKTAAGAVVTAIEAAVVDNSSRQELSGIQAGLLESNATIWSGEGLIGKSGSAWGQFQQLYDVADRSVRSASAENLTPDYSETSDALGRSSQGNNTSLTAFEIGTVTNATLIDNLTIHNAQDIDWYSFATPTGLGATGNTLKVNATNSAPIKVAFYDAARELIAQREGLENSFDLTEGSDYFIKVETSTGRQDIAYQMDVDLVATEPTQEIVVADLAEGSSSNDVVAKATALTFNTESDTTLANLNLSLTDGDQDWFEISAGRISEQSPNLFSVVLDESDLTNKEDVVIELADASGTVLATSTAIGGNETVIFEDYTSDIFINVKSGSGKVLDYKLDLHHADYDVDGSGSVNSATDGEAILASLFSNTTTSEVAGNLFEDASAGATSLQSFMSDYTTTLLDVDGDGVTKASTDGVIIDAYIAGASADLLLPLISSDSPITTSDELLTHLLEIA